MLAAQIEPTDDALVGFSVRARTPSGFADAGRLEAARTAEQVTMVETVPARTRGVTTQAGTTAADHVVLAAGVWAPQIAGLPRPLPVEPVRGQMAATAWPAGTPAAILYHDRGYVLARGADALLGTTMEHAGFDCRVTNEGLAQVFRGAVRLLATLLKHAVQRMWAGLRPVTADGRPIVGPDPEVERLWYATGHGRNGILLAALTGEIIADLVTKGETDVDISALRVERLTRLTADR